MRDSAIFYRSFFEAIKTLSKEEQADVWNAICEFSFNESVCELKGTPAAIFTLIKPQLEANNRRYANGKKPKHKQNGSKTEAKAEQNESESEANKNKNNNVNNNIYTSLRSEQFEKFWEYYGKKGSKKAAKDRFMKLSENDLEQMRAHLPHYLKATPDRKFRKDAERYLSNKLWENGDIDQLQENKPKLPDGWWNIDLTAEQWLLVPEKDRAEKKRHDMRRAMGV